MFLEIIQAFIGFIVQTINMILSHDVTAYMFYLSIFFMFLTALKVIIAFVNAHVGGKKDG